MVIPTRQGSGSVLHGRCPDRHLHARHHQHLFVLGYQYNFSKRTRVWAEYTNSDADSDLIGTAQALSIGTRVDF